MIYIFHAASKPKINKQTYISTDAFNHVESHLNRNIYTLF